MVVLTCMKTVLGGFDLLSVGVTCEDTELSPDCLLGEQSLLNKLVAFIRKLLGCLKALL